MSMRRMTWVALLAAVSTAVLAGNAWAVDPPGPLTLRAPDSGTATLKWTGTVLPGTNGTSVRCLSDVNVLSDEESFKLLGVSDAWYRTHRALLKIRIAWTPAV